MTQNDRPRSSGSNAHSMLGPLMVSKVNPRYFTVASGSDSEQHAVYLTGSYIWNNFHDGMGPGSACGETPERFDYPGYLRFLKAHGHNFIRLWRWEQFQSQAAGGNYHLCMAPQPWARTGSGTAHDGKPKFDLESFDQTYFDRLRDRVMAAGNEGIYVGVIFFEGFGLHLSPVPDNVEGHPFHASNNINGVGIASILDYQVLPLHPHVQALQEAYIRKVVDTLHDRPNVLWEVANESPGGGTIDLQFARMLGLNTIPDWGDSTEWQYWVMEVVKWYEQAKGYEQHPMGMTMQFPVEESTKVNEPMFNSQADWISPGYDDEIFSGGGHPNAPSAPQSHWLENPPANNGKKVIITDTDHYAAGKGDALWAWKSFLRGHHPILMDFGIIEGLNPTDASSGNADTSPYQAFEAARYAMGDTLRLSQRVNLILMEPREDLSSTRYALISPREYIVLQPSETAEPFTVNLNAGTYSVEWFDVNRRETKAVVDLTVQDAGHVTFIAPFNEAGPVVLYLKRIEK